MNKKYSFRTINNGKCIDGKVVYNKDEEIDCRANIGLTIEDCPFSLMIGMGYNRCDCSMITGKVIWFGGHNSKQLWKKEKLIFPQSQKGEIYIENELKPIMDGQWYVQDWITYYDEKQNILCIGDCNTRQEDIAIEFCTNIIAVFEDKYLKAIWIKDIDFTSKIQ